MNEKHMKYRNIVISIDNYLILKKLGRTADSFNDVLSRILKEKKSLQQDIRIGRPHLEVSSFSNHMEIRDPNVISND